MTLSRATLLITGGRGSFGNAVLRRFLRTGIDEIRIFSRDEKKQDEMRRLYADPRIGFYIGDVRNYHSLVDPMTGTDYVFHAAALKQVPTCEFCPMEALLSSAVGCQNAPHAVVAYQVRHRGPQPLRTWAQSDDDHRQLRAASCRGRQRPPWGQH